MEGKPQVKDFKSTRLADLKGSGLYSDGFDIPNRRDREKGYEALSMLIFLKSLKRSLMRIRIKRLLLNFRKIIRN
jgi:hypothetical protein